MNNRYYIFSFLLSLSFLNIDWANGYNNYHYKQVSFEQGLSQGTINSLYLDHNGTMWVGTNSGLNTFYKDEFVVYKHDDSNTFSLPSNIIYYVFEDALNNIWVSTDKGLVMYDAPLNSFKSISSKNQLITDTMYSYILLSDGILFSSANGFYKYSYKTREVKKISIKGSSNETFYFDQISRLDNGHLLLRNRMKGLYKLRLSDYRIEKIGNPSSQNVMAICCDGRGNYYYSIYKKGIWGYDKNGNNLFHLSTTNSKMTNDIVLCMTLHNNRLWIGTDGGGISIIDLTIPYKIHSLQHKPGCIGTLPNNSIKTLYADHQNNLWAGTVRDGLFSIQSVPFRTYKDVCLKSPNGISEKVINCLYEDESGVLWIGTDGGGLNSYDAKTDRFTHYQNSFGRKIVSINKYSETELLVSDYERGLCIFNKRAKTFKPFMIVDNSINNHECFSGYAVFLDRMSDDEILIESIDTYLYNLRLKNFRKLIIKELKDNIGAMRFIYANKDKAFFRSANRILLLEKQKLEIHKVYDLPKSEYINTAAWDGENKIWLGTEVGLSYYNMSDKKLKRIKTRLFNGVSMLFYDDRKRLWVNSQNMLFLYDDKKNKFTQWGSSDGYTGNEILSPPIISQKDSVYYMGGVSGLVKVEKNIKISEGIAPIIKLSDLIIDGRMMQTTEKISLKHDYKSLAIKIKSIDTDIFRDMLFRYTLKGYDMVPIETYKHSLSLPHMPHGKYKLYVSCNTKEGNWTTPILLLNITVEAPWYQHPLFIISMLGLIILIIYLFIRYTLRKKEKRLAWEMKDHEQQMNEEKIKFFMNVNHELRTPLTLIYAPLKRLLETKNIGTDVKHDYIINDDVIAVLRGMYKQASKMRDIVNMVLDLNKMGNIDIIAIKSSISLNTWIREICEDFRKEFDYQNINLQYNLSEKIKNVMLDSSKCEIVLSNFLMNALKFSYPHTTIIVSSSIEKDFIRVSVSDQGIGLKDTNVSCLFERYYQGDHNKNGYGIGLSYAKALIDVQGGQIGALNNIENGATFYYEIPYDGNNGELISSDSKTESDLIIPTSLTNIEITGLEMAKYTVAIVEDKIELQNFLKSELIKIFKKVYVASNGKDALQMILKDAPDIIISDVMMPYMDGYELCNQIKSNISISHIPIILLTARTDERSTTLGYKSGADVYMPKPFDMETLVSILRNQLKMREQIRSFFSRGTMDNMIIDALTTNNLDEMFLKELNEIILNNISNIHLDVKLLMRELGISRTPLYNKIKALTGIGVNEYINNIRIQQAKKLLESTDKSITEISDTVGFTYQRYFSTIFKQITGISPSDYRKERKKERTLEKKIP